MVTRAPAQACLDPMRRFPPRALIGNQPRASPVLPLCATHTVTGLAGAGHEGVQVAQLPTSFLASRMRPSNWTLFSTGLEFLGPEERSRRACLTIAAIAVGITARHRRSIGGAVYVLETLTVFRQVRERRSLSRAEAPA